MTAMVLGPIGNLGAHAAEYAQQGLEVFPVNPQTKAPLTQHGMQNATTDIAQVRQWWTQYPDASIGCRIPVDMVILDIDPRHGGHKTWQELLTTYLADALISTRVHYSGRGDGGGHVWFQRPTGKLSIKALDAWAESVGVGEHIGTRHVCGIDLLHHDHRYTIAPPSVHALTGKPYRWKGHGLMVPVAPMPGWLAHYITADAAAPPVATGDELRELHEPLVTGGAGDSIADWFTATQTWARILCPHGWHISSNDGERDGSVWLHPRATSSASATITHGCLFVYTPNTPFEVTSDGDPHGYTRFAAWALLNHAGDLSAAGRAARELRDGPRLPDVSPYDLLPKELMAAPDAPTQDDEVPHLWWPDFWRADRAEREWICEPVLPKGRQVALWATHKTGKSLLTLDIAAAYATGRPMLGQANDVPPGVVLYLDMEMTEDDLFERLTDMGYGPTVDLERLRYFLLPSLGALDTPEGARTLVRLVDRHTAQLVVIDTMSRVISGDENDAKTFQAFYRLTGLALKQRGVTLLRLDHGGKDDTKGQRGSSAKGDDVDIVWRLSQLDGDDLLLRRERSRIGWVPEKVRLQRQAEPLAHMIVGGGEAYPAGTSELAQRLDELQVPNDRSAVQVSTMLRDIGEGRRRELINAAVRWRNERDGALILSGNDPGTPPGTPLSQSPGNRGGNR